LDGDTLFCFTIPQSKVLAKQIQSNTYCDSLIGEQEVLIGLLEKSGITKDNINNQLETKIVNLNTINQNQDSETQLLEKYLEVKEKKLKRSKTHRVLLSIGLGIMTILAIAT
jgi:hypothetical protein